MEKLSIATRLWDGLSLLGIFFLLDTTGILRCIQNHFSVG